jgi:membrane protein implicated in regulation of membrane protease activity
MLSLLTAILLWGEGLALGAVGWWQDRLGLAAGGLGLAALGCLVIVVWRRYRRALEEIQTGRAQVRSEVESLRALLRR